MIKKINVVLAIVLGIFVLTFAYVKTNKLELVQKYKIKNTPIICGDIKLGGFSDLFYKDGYLYAITDRGPNSKAFVDKGKTLRIFSCPEYTTYLVKFKLKNDEAKIVEATPIKGLYGIPVAAEKDSTPYDKNKKQLPFNINGADIECFIIDKDGNYWLGDEYYPSIIKLDKNLNVVKRFAPENSEVKNPKVTYNLPKQFNNVRKNLGFESMAYDGKDYIYVFTQAGLKGETDISVIKFNIKTENAEDVYKYRFAENSIMSAATFAQDGKFYVAERLFKKHFLDEISFRNGTLRRTLVLRPLTKKDKINANMKIEGLAKDEEGYLYIINDNDFGIDDENVKDSFIVKYRFKDIKNLSKSKK
ncbi:esterase-like activity of phytase family protein [bacterium]|nr:esterase-like activity of phytase family protein [bacterium]